MFLSNISSSVELLCVRLLYKNLLDVRVTALRLLVEMFSSCTECPSVLTLKQGVKNIENGAAKRL